MTATQAICRATLGLIYITAATSQTQIDLRTQGRDVDFTSALSTKPIRTGATLPSTCSVGEAYFLTSAPAGQNLSFCASPNVWVPQGQGGTLSPQGQPSPAITRTDAATLAFGPNCSATNACNARVGGVVYSYVGSASVSLSSGSTTVRIYISDGSDGAPPGTWKVRSSAASGVTCAGGCVVEFGQSAFPGMSIPLAIWSATSPGTWDAIGQDLRAGLSTNPAPLGGRGILITQGATTSISVDTSVIPRKFGGSGSPGNIVQSSLGDFYSDTVNNDTYECFNAGPCTVVGTGNWVKIVSGGGSLDTTGVTKKFSGQGVPQAVSGSTLGDLYGDLTNNDTYQCFAVGPCTAPGAGNWVKVDSSGGGGAAPPTIGGLYATYNGTNYFPLSVSNGLPDAATFSWLNQPAGAVGTLVGGHALHLVVPIGASSINNLAILEDNAALSSSSFTIQAAISGCVIPALANGSLCAIGLTDGTKVISFGPTYFYAVFAMSVIKWSDVHTLNGQDLTLNVPFMQNIALKIVLSGGNLTFYYSVDGGASYDPVLTESITSFFSSASGLSAVWMVNNNFSGGLAATTLTDWKIR